MRQKSSRRRRHRQPFTTSVGSAPLPPLPEQQEKLGRISGSKLDPGREDEETLVTSLPTPRGPKITFLSEKTGETPPGRAWRRAGGGWGGEAKHCTQTRLSCTVPPSKQSKQLREGDPPCCETHQKGIFFFFCVSFFFILTQCKANGAIS